VYEQDIQDLLLKIRPTALKIQQSISFYTCSTFLSLYEPNPYLVFAAKKLMYLTIERLKSNWHYWNYKQDGFYGQTKQTKNSFLAAKMSGQNWREEAPTWIWESKGSGDILYGGIVSDLSPGLLQTHQAL